MRAIIRISFDGDEGSKLRNQLEGVFARHGYQRSKTATWEADRATSADTAEFLRELWGAINDHAANGGAARLDHFWMYMDHGAPKSLFTFDDLPISQGG